MARAALNWSLGDLATAAAVRRNTITNFETGDAGEPRKLAAIRAALELAGVIFVEENGEGPGVRLRKGAARGTKTACTSDEPFVGHYPGNTAYQPLARARGEPLLAVATFNRQKPSPRASRSKEIAIFCISPRHEQRRRPQFRAANPRGGPPSSRP